MSLSALCKVCAYYNAVEKTCSRSVIAVSHNKFHHDYAKTVRLDKTRCGPQGKWFAKKTDELTPVEELVDI